MSHSTDSLDQLPPNWHIISSTTNPNAVYYFNSVSRVSSWTKPTFSDSKPEKVHCRHILIKHKDVRNPKSKRTNLAVTRTRAQALTYITGLQEQLLKLVQEGKSNAEQEALFTAFSEIANKESDCTSYKHGGDLGQFRAKTMQKEFSLPAFELEVGQMSGIVESQSGFHIILRIA